MLTPLFSAPVHTLTHDVRMTGRSSPLQSPSIIRIR